MLSFLYSRPHLERPEQVPVLHLLLENHRLTDWMTGSRRRGLFSTTVLFRVVGLWNPMLGAIAQLRAFAWREARVSLACSTRRACLASQASAGSGGNMLGTCPWSGFLGTIRMHPLPLGCVVTGPRESYV